MITMTQLKRALNNCLREKFSKIKIYGNEVIDGYKTPAFFTEILPGGFEHETKNYGSNEIIFKITYFQTNVDEADQLRVVDELQELFWLKFECEGRKLNITKFEYDYAGKEHNILQVSISINWYDNTARKEDADITENIIIRNYENNNLEDIIHFSNN